MDLMIPQDDVAPAAWQQEKTVDWFLASVRGAIPFADSADQARA